MKTRCQYACVAIGLGCTIALLLTLIIGQLETLKPDDLKTYAFLYMNVLLAFVSTAYSVLLHIAHEKVAGLYDRYKSMSANREACSNNNAIDDNVLANADFQTKFRAQEVKLTKAMLLCILVVILVVCLVTRHRGFIGPLVSGLVCFGVNFGCTCILCGTEPFCVFPLKRSIEILEEERCGAPHMSRRACCAAY